jgi:hypothetical protein
MILANLLVLFLVRDNLYKWILYLQSKNIILARTLVCELQ